MLLLAYSIVSFFLREKVVVSKAQFNPFLKGYKLMFSFRRLLNFVNKLCCNYHEHQTQKVVFFSAVVFSSVMPKNYQLVGMLNGQNIILDYPNFPLIRTAPLRIKFSLFG